MTTAEPTSPPPLDYAQRPAGLRRRRVIRVLIILMIVGAGVAAYRWREAISYRVNLYYFFNRAMNHVTPPGQVLVEFDPLKARKLIDTDLEYENGTSYVHLSIPSGKVRVSAPTKRGLMAIYVPPELRKLEAYMDTQANDYIDAAAVFVGERRTPSGTRRLVIIRGAAPSIGLLSTLGGVVYEPPTLLKSPVWKNPQQAFSYSNDTSPRATLSAGVADPSDPSHLTIGYMISATGERGRIDVYLMDNDLLNFVQRPAATRAAP
jgi:hypothetical protein